MIKMCGLSDAEFHYQLAAGEYSYDQVQLRFVCMHINTNEYTFKHHTHIHIHAHTYTRPFFLNNHI